jgi:hypothetical protein
MDDIDHQMLLDQLIRVEGLTLHPRRDRERRKELSADLIASAGIFAFRFESRKYACVPSCYVQKFRNPFLSANQN